MPWAISCTPPFNSCAQTNTRSLSFAYAGRVPRGALPQRAEPRERDAVRVVAEPVHGVRPPLHLLLRPRLRGARRPALRRPLRRLDPGEDERRRGAARGARAHEL